MMTGRMTEKDGDSEILKAFKLFVPEDGGKISVEHLRRVATEVRLLLLIDKAFANQYITLFPPFSFFQLGETKISDIELQQMISEADHDGDGAVSQEDFLKIMKAQLE